MSLTVVIGDGPTKAADYCWSGLGPDAIARIDLVRASARIGADPVGRSGRRKCTIQGVRNGRARRSSSGPDFAELPRSRDRLHCEGCEPRMTGRLPMTPHGRQPEWTRTTCGRVAARAGKDEARTFRTLRPSTNMECFAP